MLNSVLAYCKQNQIIAPNDRIVVGVSGGPDSLCLLHLLKSLQPSLNLHLTVAHLNHQLRGDAARNDADFVADLAGQWQLAHFGQAQNVAALAVERRQSLEEAARQVRYAFLWQVAHQTGSNKIAVGHHADDQAETLLMHLLRGAGLDGLRGMQPAVNIAALQLHPNDYRTLPTQSAPTIIRPLLAVSRAEIEAYCHANGLAPRHDHTNRDITLLRNRIRHQLLPLLESYNPNIRRVLWRTATLLDAEAEFLSAQLAQVWPRLVQSAGQGRISLYLEPLQGLPLALKRAAMRQAITRLEPSRGNLGFDHIDSALAIINAGKTGAQVTLPHGLRLTVSYQTITIAAGPTPPPIPGHPALPPGAALEVTVPGETAIPGSNWRLTGRLMPAAQLKLEQLQQGGPWQAWLDADVAVAPLKLRTRQPGDLFSPLGLGGRHQTLKKFMINAKIPAAQRTSWPLLVSEETIIWVCGHRPAHQVAIGPHTRNIIFLKFDTI
ncbi:MAG: tRNA lysidine(34) synthetase TilS [Anaerolineae bacterium]